ncbi:MAG: hypothetical protein ABEN55_22235, partial [Bradymonadaceae bacterium]
ALIHLGVLNSLQSDAQPALERLNKAQRQLTESAEPKLYGTCLEFRGNVYRSPLHDYDRAEELIGRARQVFEGEGLEKKVWGCDRRLTVCAINRGTYEQAETSGRE